MMLSAGTLLLPLPSPARAQPADKVRRVGVIMVQDEHDPEGVARFAAFRDGLRSLGWIEGRNLHLDVLWGGVPSRADAHAKALIAASPDVLLANGTPATAAFQRATRDIPIVFAVVTDPVGGGFVRSLVKPGANITGFSTFEPEIGGKWLETLREFAPGLRRVGLLFDPELPGFAEMARLIETLSRERGLAFVPIIYRGNGENLDAPIARLAAEPESGLIVVPNAANNVSRASISALAERHRIPAVYTFREYVAAGGLMAYGPDPRDILRLSAAYVDRILKGARPADLPVQAPTKFLLILNLKAAKALGRDVSPMLLARADEVLE